MPDILAPTSEAALPWPELDGFIRELDPEARRVDGLAAKFPADGRWAAAWDLKLVTNCAGIQEVVIVLPRSFPVGVPRVILRNAPDINTWPHVGPGGQLCLWYGDPSFGGANPIEVLQTTIARARRLIDDGASGNNRDEFLDEVHSYWGYVCKPGLKFLSLLEQPGETRRATCARISNSQRLLAETPEVLDRWLAKTGKASSEGVKSSPCIVASLDRALYPNEYPETVNDLSRLLRQRDDHAAELLDQTLAQGSGLVAVVVTAPTLNGLSMVGMLLREGVPAGGKPGVSKFKRKQNGFPRQNVPLEVAAARWRGIAKLDRFQVERVDASWVHGRGLDRQAAVLRGKRVVVLGCGSLGSVLAMDLAMAGVGHLVLVDPELLESANVGRHELGMRDIGSGKARALAGRIGERLPHVELEYHAGTWQTALSHPGDPLGECDLIVSAIGSWSEQWELNEWHTTRARTPEILYAWTEAHACAGHAVLIGHSGGCFACGHGMDGVPSCEVTAWDPQQALLPEPACGAVFTPYGALDMAPTSGMASELAIDALLGKATTGSHWIWTSRATRLEDAGGAWTQSWSQRGEQFTVGGRRHELTWPSGPCGACEKSAPG